MLFRSLAPPQPPRYVVVLGGGGVPSGSTLIRTYYAARFGPHASYVVALPADDDSDHSSVGRMRDELVMRGIPAAAIQMETRGRNTAEQAAGVAKLLGAEACRQPVVLVSSEYHLRRAVGYFRQAGFSNLSALNAASTGAEADPGRWAGLRYGIWNNWHAELKMLRELLGIAAGKLTGRC